MLPTPREPYEVHHGTTEQTYSDPITIQLWGHKLEPEARTNQAAHSHTHSEVITVFLPPFLEDSLTCGTPLGGSWEWINLPFRPV
jgi:hypothetical protein